ncbi:MAG: hypothetical protein H6Q16_68 [Bacteroidetes bacterium]|nr:hypothetical protein [Bacteroidota bacterium]
MGNNFIINLSFLIIQNNLKFLFRNSSLINKRKYLKKIIKSFILTMQTNNFIRKHAINRKNTIFASCLSLKKIKNKIIY